MKFFSSDTDYVDIDLYETRLNQRGHIFMDITSLGIYSFHQSALASSLSRMCVDYMNMVSERYYTALSHNSVVEYLTKDAHVDMHKLKAKGVAKTSLDKRKVLLPLYLNGYAKEFLSMYMGYSESKTRSDRCMKVFERNKNNPRVQGWEEELSEIYFTATPQVNLRFNYNNEDIIGFPSSTKKFMKAPQDYVLVWGDFAQSDARIAYNTLIKDDENIKLIQEYPDDIYAGFANLVSRYKYKVLLKKYEEAKSYAKSMQDFDPSYNPAQSLQDYEKQIANYEHFKGFKDKKERETYKVCCLETIYGTRKHVVRNLNQFVSMFGNVLMECPKYRKYWDDIEYRSKLGEPIRLRCPFGHIEQVPAYDGTQTKRTLYKCLNYPVQGGSSEIVILVTNAILDTFYSMGYSEDDISVFMVRHDEPIFLVKKSLMKDSWVFKDFGTIQIDDWTPLKCDFSFGYAYSEVDRKLTDDYKLSCKINASKFQTFTPLKSQKEYYPLDPLLTVGSSVVRLDDNYKAVILYNHDLKALDVRKIPSTLDDTNALVGVVEKYLKNIKQRGYTHVVVYNSQHLDLVLKAGDVNLTRIFKYHKGVETACADVLARWVQTKYTGSEFDSYLNDNTELLNSVVTYGLFCDTP